MVGVDPFQWLNLLFIVAFWTGDSVVYASRVELVNNGYINLVIAVKPSTPKDQSEIIINNIQRMIREASPILYKATNNRAYFRSFRILIPESWDHINANPASWETFQKADVIVDEPNPKYLDRPYTRQNGQCGEPGESIHLTPNYIATLEEEKNNLLYGNPGKVFVHEWAHYRYGVFDEYGTAGDPDYPLFYRLYNSTAIVPNICTDAVPIYELRDISTNSSICQVDPKTQNYDKNCRFELQPEFQPESSLSSHHLVDSVVHFCRDDQKHAHKYDAPNKHNAMCGSVSAWSVIMRSPDFAQGNNNPVDLNELSVDFQIVRANKSSSLRFMLVFDVSSSMRICNRIGKLGDSVRSWIKNDLPSGSQLGMVMFSYYAHIVSEMVVITDMESRQAMMKKVPSNQVFSETCIGCGLTIAAQMLKEAGEGGIILLATDGGNTRGLLDICDVEREIIDAGIKVITIAIGNDADKNLESLADKTDGKTYFVCDKGTSAAFHEAFMGALTYQPSVSDSDLHFKLLEAKIVYVRPRTYTGYFDIDDAVGRNLKLSVYNVEKKSLIRSIELIGPDGRVFGNIEFESSTAFLTVQLAETGRWEFVIKIQEKQDNSLLLSVTTQLLPEVKTPITTECWIARVGDAVNACTNPVKIHAQAMKGYHPVIGATVRAYIEKPNNEVEIIELFDNGVNADTTLNDGVYSKYYLNATQPGRYSVKCQVANDGHAYESPGFIGSANPFMDVSSVETSRRRRQILQEKIQIGNFSRITSGGSFQVETPVSNGDAYPPGNVKDLSAILVDETGMDVSVHLRWTAPGDELDSGTVKYYELTYSSDAADLIESNSNKTTQISEHNIVAGSLHPHESGSPQSVVLLFPNVKREKSYYVALRSINTANKTSKVSNIAAFFVPQKVEMVIENDKDLESTIDQNLNEDNRRQVVELKEFDVEATFNLHDSESHNKILIIGAGSVGLILILGLAAFLLILYLKNARRTKPYHAMTSVPTI